jgi:5,10-methylenetetrahydromethanopterin reductase
MTTQPRCGVALQGVDPPIEFIDKVREIDALGFDNLWLTDSSLHTRDCYSYLTLAATVSTRLGLGPAVTNPLSRHPGITAAALATVDEVSGGRAILGIGAGDRPLRALGLRTSSVATLEATVGAIRRLWRGEELNEEVASFRFRDAHLRFQPRPDIPIFVSASGPRTLELAGRVADGVILLIGLFPEAVAWALSHVDRGAESAGRPRPHIAVFAYGAIDDDEARALEAARSIAAWFPQTAPHVCELAGVPASIVDDVRRLYSGGEFQEAAAAARLMPDDFVRRVALAGDHRQATARIEEVLGAGADSMHVFPLGDRRMETVRAFAACWRDVVKESGAQAPAAAGRA